MVFPNDRTEKTDGAFKSYHSFFAKGSPIFFLPPFLPFEIRLFLPMAIFLFWRQIKQATPTKSINHNKRRGPLTDWHAIALLMKSAICLSGWDTASSAWLKVNFVCWKEILCLTHKMENEEEQRLFVYQLSASLHFEGAGAPPAANWCCVCGVRRVFEWGAIKLRSYKEKDWAMLWCTVLRLCASSLQLTE